MGLLDEMLSEITNKGNKKGSILDIAQGTSATIRFITEGDMVQKVSVHSRFVKGVKGVSYTVPCPLSYGHKTCLLEGKDDKYSGGNRDTKNHFMFLVYDYRDSKIKTMFYKANMCSPLERIGNYYYDVGTLLGRDFVIARNNAKGIEIRYSMKSEKPSTCPDSVQNIIDSTFPEQSKMAFWQYERTAIAEAFHPQLLKPDFEMSDLVLKDVADIADENDVEDMFAKKETTQEGSKKPAFRTIGSKKPVQKEQSHAHDYGEINVEDDDELLLDTL